MKEASARSTHRHPYLALSTFLGTVIGVGVFGLPFVASTMGLFLFCALLLLLAGVLLFLHLRYADLVLGTKEQHRTPGYIATYLGGRWRGFAVGLAILSLIGALVAYGIVGSAFLRLLTSPWMSMPQTAALALFVLLGGMVVARGVVSVAKFDIALLGIFAAIIIAFVFAALPRVISGHYTMINFTAIPQGYGVALFALSGLTAIPALVMVTHRNRQLVRASVTVGSGIALFLYILFVVSVVGVNGPATTPDALTGFLSVLGSRWMIVVGLLGFATTLSSFINLGTTLKATLVLDSKFPLWLSLLVVTLVPFGLIALGLTNLTSVLGVTGGILGGTEALLVLFAAERYKKSHGWVRGALGFVYVLLSLGIVFELWYILRSFLR